MYAPVCISATQFQIFWLACFDIAHGVPVLVATPGQPALETPGVFRDRGSRAAFSGCTLDRDDRVITFEEIEFNLSFRKVARTGIDRCSAAKVGISGALGIAILIGLACAGCLPWSPEARPAAENTGSYSRYSATPPSQEESFCAWFGEERDGVLYFGQSAFWWAFRSSEEDPTADLAIPGPQHIGRFDIGKERMLPPIDLENPLALSGVWDVLPHVNGRIYFTSLFESAGYVDPEAGAVVRFDHLGPGLNELALGPSSTLIASRYGGESEATGGAVVWLDLEGEVQREFRLETPEGGHLEPKTVAYDPVRERIWVTTDRLDPNQPSTASGFGGYHHPTLVMDLDGRVVERIENVEIQFVRFLSDGTGHLAHVSQGRLQLETIRPTDAGESRDGNESRSGDESRGGDKSDREEAHDAVELHVLDPRFPVAYDFVQDLQVAGDGRVVVTRWSGVVHVVDPEGRVASSRLPDLDPHGLYYSAAVEGDRVCATYCADVSVVCGPAPVPGQSRSGAHWRELRDGGSLAILR